MGIWHQEYMNNTIFREVRPIEDENKMYMLCIKDKINFSYGSYWAEILWVGIWHQVNTNNTIFWRFMALGGENKCICYVQRW